MPELARMLARAFLDDPVASWAWKPDAMREKALERFQAVRLRQLIAGDEVWTNDELSCAALWAPPGQWHMSLRETAMLVPCFRHPRLLARIGLVALGWEKLERDHPRKPPHLYLAVLGTDPSAQGRGLGSAVLAGVVERCDHDGTGGALKYSEDDGNGVYAGIGAYLESSKESNVGFYERFGFRVIGEHRLTRGPKMWLMWRDPPGAAPTR